ncbi:MAG TPA: cytochrome c biogenesis heme-transporting ATPase CcmA [Ramlibacter sp.]|uniref:cytochrome c biogenesis heme-transporting ATPase CcmA n=1 Tax=Ramlibacter sp. TaxID=1917967 RepID=UPI002CA4E382|nr:cytochrome c biogenesis heme-transporting ATPase CcmA [Ramlibacter sp.]HVZ43696.1 cytochrome c biogenesis heme-transporting ATPase CcmA [Ramlibacter sp.]
MSSPAHKLEVRDLACIRGDRRLFDGVSFTLEPGALLFLGGANGAGKTSLLRLLCGLSPAESGDIRWNGKPIGEQAGAFRGELCYLGHQNALQEALTVEENLRFLAALGGCTPPQGAIPRALARLGLHRCERRFVRQLSQGQKRRVALARLLLTAATLWVLDEPFVALDTAAVKLVAGLLEEHLARGGMAIYTSHQPVEIAARSSRSLQLAARVATPRLAARAAASLTAEAAL